jgi:hypothetical protein
MVKKFTINCKIGNQESPLDLFVGNPNDSSHPIGFQMKFFSKLGVEIPENVVKSLSNLNEIAKRNRIPFEDVLGYVSDQLNSADEINSAFEKAHQFTSNLNNKDKK